MEVGRITQLTTNNNDLTINKQQALITKLSDLERLENFFSYRITKHANSYGYEVTIWDEYSLSVTEQGGTLKEAVNKAIQNFPNRR